MRHSASLGSIASLAGLCVLGCAGAPSQAARVPPQAEPEPEAALPLDSRWLDEVRSVAAAFPLWGRVDDEMRWAPYKCALPQPASAHWSESKDVDTHGQKLYALYVMDPEAYGAPPSHRVPIGMPIEVHEVLPEAEVEAEQEPEPRRISQAIVKEAFAPEPFYDDTKLEWFTSKTGERPLWPAEKDGRRFAAGERKGLYIMMKIDDATDGTDAGWVYATVDADMRTVTAVGVIDSCADCHAQAGDDRLFGLPD